MRCPSLVSLGADPLGPDAPVVPADSRGLRPRTSPSPSTTAPTRLDAQLPAPARPARCHRDVLRARSAPGGPWAAARDRGGRPRDRRARVGPPPGGAAPTAVALRDGLAPDPGPGGGRNRRAGAVVPAAVRPGHHAAGWAATRAGLRTVLWSAWGRDWERRATPGLGDSAGHRPAPAGRHGAAPRLRPHLGPGSWRTTLVATERLVRQWRPRDWRRRVGCTIALVAPGRMRAHDPPRHLAGRRGRGAGVDAVRHRAAEPGRGRLPAGRLAVATRAARSTATTGSTGRRCSSRSSTSPSTRGGAVGAALIGSPPWSPRSCSPTGSPGSPPVGRPWCPRAGRRRPSSPPRCSAPAWSTASCSRSRSCWPALRGAAAGLDARPARGVGWAAARRRGRRGRPLVKQNVVDVLVVAGVLVLQALRSLRAAAHPAAGARRRRRGRRWPPRPAWSGPTARGTEPTSLWDAARHLPRRGGRGHPQLVDRQHLRTRFLELLGPPALSGAPVLLVGHGAPAPPAAVTDGPPDLRYAGPAAAAVGAGRRSAPAAATGCTT